MLGYLGKGHMSALILGVMYMYLGSIYCDKLIASLNHMILLDDMKNLQKKKISKLNQLQMQKKKPHEIVLLQQSL